MSIRRNVSTSDISSSDEKMIQVGRKRKNRICSNSENDELSVSHIWMTGPLRKLIRHSHMDVNVLKDNVVIWVCMEITFEKHFEWIISRSKQTTNLDCRLHLSLIDVHRLIIVYDSSVQSVSAINKYAFFSYLSYPALWYFNDDTYG